MRNLKYILLILIFFTFGFTSGWSERYLVLPELSTTPASMQNFGFFYVKTDSLPYFLDDSNVSHPLSSTGMVVGPGASTDNAIARWDGVTGFLIKDSTFLIDGNDMTVPDGGTIGQAAGPLLTFDDTNNFLEITGCFVALGHDTPIAQFHIDSDDGNIKFGTGVFANKTVSTDTGIEFNDTGRLKSGLFTEVNGEILSYAINVPQIGDRDTGIVGGIFRLDARAGIQKFSIIGYPTGGSVATDRLVVNLQTGNVRIPGMVGIGTEPFFILDIDGAQGNVRVKDLSSHTVSSDMGIIFDGDGTVESGMLTEVDGRILSLGINTAQLTSRETDFVGGLFRFDTRGGGNLASGQRAFSILGNSEGEGAFINPIGRFIVSLVNGDTALVPNGGKVGVGTTDIDTLLHLETSAAEDIIIRLETTNVAHQVDIRLDESSGTDDLYIESIDNLIIDGAVSVTGLSVNVVTKTAAYTATVTDDIITCGAGNESFTVDLPPGAAGKLYTVTNVGTGVINVDADTTGSTTINGNTDVDLFQDDSIRVQYNGTEYRIL